MNPDMMNLKNSIGGKYEVVWTYENDQRNLDKLLYKSISITLHKESVVWQKQVFLHLEATGTCTCELLKKLQLQYLCHITDIFVNKEV